MFFTKHAAALALVAAMPMAAQAATPANNFNFASGSLLDTISSAPSYVSGALQVVIRAFDASNKQMKVASNSSGLGATTGAFLESGDLNASSASLLTAAKAEYLTLTFNQAVNLNSFSLTGWSNGLLGFGTESATLTWGTKSFALGTNNSGSPLVTFTPVGASGTVFKLQATGSSAFRLAGLNATATGAVPEPGTYALMGLGLVGLGWVSRRRQG